MNAVVDPNGPKLAVVLSNPVPEGARVGYFRTQDNIRIRYGLWPRLAGPPKGTVCLVHGRTEFIEKYFETIHDFQQRGFAVATFDWRGQGGSERLIGNKRLGYVDQFDDYLIDLTSFHAEILLPDCPPPFYLVAHSMGGLVALNAGIRDRMMFDRMFLSAPMVAIGGLPFGTAGTALFADALSFAGLGRFPIARRADKTPTEASFANNPLTSDITRFLYTVDTLAAEPSLEVSSPSVRWLAAALHAMAKVETDEFPGAVRIPVLMLAAARDEVVSTPATEALGLRMRTGRHMVVAGARHELFVENDTIRGQVFAAFDAFITEQSGS